MALLRRLAGLLIIAASFGCPKAVNAPIVKVESVAPGLQIGQVIRLDASGSSDPQGRDLTFVWQFTIIPVGSTATLNNARSATPSFIADVDGEFDVQVVVSNAFVSAAAVTVKVNVGKCGGRAPVFGANAVTAKDAARPTITNNFAVGATIVLASDVSDPDNSTADQVCTASQNQAVSYQWKLIGQPAASLASLNNSTASSPSFVADVAGSYTVRLVATDSTNRSSVPFDQTFTVSPCGANAPTIASITTRSEQLAVGKTIQMTATPDDADNGADCQAVLGSLQTFSYQWSLLQFPNGSRASLNSAVAQNPSFTPDIDGDYLVRLVVTDSTGRSSAPKDTTVHIPRCGNNAPVATITAPSGGFLGVLVQLGETVTDADGPVNGGPPPASPACTPTIAQTVTLKWSIAALPAGSQAQLNNLTGTNPSFTPDVAGTYTVQLVATDQSGLSSAPDTKAVLVAPCGATPPSITKIDTSPAAGATTVNANTAVALVAPVIVPDNSCLPTAAQESLTYQWSMVSKPAGSNAFIVKPTATGTASDPATFTPDVANGTYQVQLVVAASNGLKSAPAFFSIFTNTCGTNAPTVSASTTGADNTSPNAGFDTVTLTAHGTDPDNGAACSPALPVAQQQALSFKWTMVSRPSGSSTAITVSTTPNDGSVATFKPDVIGPYQFSVVVTDSTGLSSAPSLVTVQTSLCGSRAPVISSATATPALVSGFTQPRPTRDTVTLDATPTGGSTDTAITDADDACFGGQQPKTFSWTVVSRPAGSSAVISGASGTVTVDATSPFLRHATATFVPDVPGAYQFQLDVTDSLGLKAASAFASITASSCSLAAPVVGAFTADTGETQFAVFTFPTPSVTNVNCLVAATSNSYVWSIVSAPAGSSAMLSNPAIATPAFTPDKVGSYQFALTVTNGAGIAAAPVFFNVSAATCGNAKLMWTSIAVTKVFDPDPPPNGTTFTGSIPANPSTGAQVTVSAVASDPNSSCGTRVQPISYQWAIVAAPKGSKAALTSATGPTPAFVPDIPNGAYQLSVVATDALGNTSVAPNFITVTSSACGANVPSVAITPADLSSTSASGGIFSMTLAAVSAGVTNADNSCTARFNIASTAYTYAWSIVSQPTNGRAMLTSATGANTNFTASVPGLYSLHVVATGPNGISSDPNQGTSFLAINVKQCGSNAPVVNSVSTFVHGTTNVLSRPAVGQQIDLVANATDLDATVACGPVPGAAVVSYAWSAISLPSGSAAPSTFNATTGVFPLTPDVAGTFTYSVVATDNTGLQSMPVSVSFSTAACQPTFGGIRAANAGGFLTASSANAVSGVKGTALTFDVPPTVTQTGTGSGTVSASGTPAAAHSYVLTISTGGALGTAAYTVSIDGAAAGAAVVIPASGIAPPASNGVANGITLNFPLGSTYTAGDTYAFSNSAGSFITDSCVKQPTYAYAWSLQKPADSQATLSTLSGASPQFTPDVVGTYAVQLVVTDNAALVSAPATLTVNAAGCGSLAPTIGSVSGSPTSPNAGAFVTLTANSIVDGNSCGSILPQPYIYSWSLISVPTGSSAMLSSQTAVSPQFVADLPNGSYQVALTITDQLGMVSAPAFATITSTACGANPPVIGTLVSTTTPLNANSPLALAAVATDADNAGACATAGFNTTVTGISWSIVSAPAGSHSSLVSSATVPVKDTATPPNFNDSNTVQANASGIYVIQAVATASNGLKSAPKTVSLNIAPTGCGTNAPVITQIAPSVGGTATSRPAVGNTVTLTTFHTDADETLAVCNPVSAQPTYVWTLSSAPAGSAQQAPVGPQASTSISFVADRAGTFVWSVVATDPFGLSSAPATIAIATGTCGPTLANLTGINEPIKAAGTGVAELGTPPGYTATQGAFVTLSTATPATTCVSGGAAPTLSWSLTTVPAGSNAVLSTTTGASPTFTADKAGTYGIQLVVTDNGGFSSVFNTTVAAGACTTGPQIVNKSAQPLSGANMFTATDTQTGTSTTNIFNGDRVQLSLPVAATGKGGFAPGACSATISYEWSMISRPAGSQSALSSTSSPTPAFSADVAGGVYQFALVVRDGLGNPNTVATDTTNATGPFFFNLTVSTCGTRAPALAGNVTFQTAPAPRANLAFAVISPAATDPNTDGICPTRFTNTSGYSYAFTVTVQPAGSTTSITGSGATQSMFVNQPGNYTVQVIATSLDNGRASAPATGTSPNVSNCGAFPPVANSFSLSQVVPNAASGATSSTLTESATTGASLTAGANANTGTSYYFGFPITISAGDVTDADFTSAGPNCAANFPSISPQTVAYAWSLIGAPAGSKLALGSATGSSLVVSPDLPGQYKLALTTTDNLGYSSTSTLSIGSAVSNTGVICGTNSPVITTGTLKGSQGTVQTPSLMTLGTAVLLGATVTDLDTTPSVTCTVAEAQPFTYQWSFTQVPAGSKAVLLAPNTLGASFTPDVAGLYKLTFTATDPQGHSVTDTTLVVDAECGTIAPSVAFVSGSIRDFTATQDLTVNGNALLHTVHASRSANNVNTTLNGVATTVKPFYPGVPVQLTANVPNPVAQFGTCPAQTDTITYQWSILSQPGGSTARINNAGAVSPSFTPDVPGPYDFQLVLTDQNGRSSTNLLTLDDSTSAFPNNHPGNVDTCGTNAPTVVTSATNGPVNIRTTVDATGSQSPDDYRSVVSTVTQTYPNGCGLTENLSYLWAFVQAPAASTAQLSSTTLINPSFIPDLAGQYTVQVTASDGKNSTSKNVVFTADSLLSTPATASAVLTATALDASGNPVVAWWDNSAGSVSAARCTSNCGSASPVWSSLDTVDSGLGPMTFAPADAPRPVAVTVSGSNTFVAYYTGHQPAAATTTATGLRPFCSLALATNAGAGWTYQTLATGTGCDSAVFGAGAQSGRYVSMAQAPGGIPVIAYFKQITATQTEPNYIPCTTAACTAFGADTPIFASGLSQQYGRWATVQVDAGGQVNAGWYSDNNSIGQRFVVYSVSASFSAPSFSPAALDGTTGDIGRFVSIAAIPVGTAANSSTVRKLVLSYRDAIAKTARFAVCTTATACAWTASAVTDPGTTDFGQDTVLTANPVSGFLRLAYLDVAHSQVRVLSGDAVAPFSVLDQFPASATPGLSIAFSNAGTRIAFANNTGALKFFAGP